MRWMPRAAAAGTEEAARVCINVGLVGAAGAAVTGLTDWTDTGQGDRRVGLIHAMLNITATSLFLTSTILRRRRRTPGATGISAAGYAFAMAGAYLGGALVYKRRIGTDHTVQGDAPEGFVRTIRIDEIPDGDKRKVRIGDADIVLVRQGDSVCALAERCAHLGGPLSEGEVRDGTIICPWHQSHGPPDERARGARAVDIRPALLCDAGERWFHRSEPGVNEARAGRSRRRTRPWLNSLHRRAHACRLPACARSRRRRTRSHPSAAACVLQCRPDPRVLGQRRVGREIGRGDRRASSSAPSAWFNDRVRCANEID